MRTLALTSIAFDVRAVHDVRTVALIDIRVLDQNVVQPAKWYRLDTPSQVLAELRSPLNGLNQSRPVNRQSSAVVHA